MSTNMECLLQPKQLVALLLLPESMMLMMMLMRLVTFHSRETNKEPAGNKNEKWALRDHASMENVVARCCLFVFVCVCAW